MRERLRLVTARADAVGDKTRPAAGGFAAGNRRRRGFAVVLQLQLQLQLQPAAAAAAAARGAAAATAGAIFFNLPLYIEKNPNGNSICCCT